MSFFEGLGFRSATPAFEPGQVIRVVLTGFDLERGQGIARIGDTILNVNGVEEDLVKQEISVEIDRFDRESSRGRAHRVGAGQ